MDVIGRRIGPDHIHQQLGGGLLDFRALDLQHRRRRIGLALAVLALIGDDAQLRHFQRLEFDLDRGQLVAEPRIVEHRAAIGLHLPRHLLDALDALLRHADPGDAGALIAKQEFGVVPALVLFAHQILDRHFDVIEEHFVDLVAAFDGDDRPHRNALRLHVDQQERNAGLLLGGGIGAHQTEDPVGILRQRGPGLLAVDDVFVAAPFRLGLQRGEIGAGARLGKALAPPIIDISDTRQKALLLRFIAESVDHRTDHRHAECQRLRRRRELQFFVEDVVLHRGPAGATILHRPMRHAPALLVEDAIPFHHFILGGVPPLDHLLPHRGRHGFLEKGADLVAECQFFLAETQIHRILPRSLESNCSARHAAVQRAGAPRMVGGTPEPRPLSARFRTARPSPCHRRHTS